MGVSSKRTKSQPSSSLGKKQRASRAAAIRARDKSGLPVRLGRWGAIIANSQDT